MRPIDADPVHLLFSLVVGVAVHGAALRAVIRARQSAGWPTTAGVLDWFKVQHRGREATLRVRYRYRVGDVEYIGTRDRFGQIPYSGSTHPQQTPFYTWYVGMPLVVRYHPRRAHLATLESEVEPGALALAVLSAFVVGSAGLLLLVSLLLHP